MVLNELNYSSESAACTNSDNVPNGHDHKPGYPTHTHYAATNANCKYDINRWHNISPVDMVIVGVVLLIATFFPPVIVALLNRGVFGPDTKPYSPKNEYQPHQSDKDPGFGGWRQYKKHVPKSTSNFSCKTEDEDKPDNLVDNWIWHFFDILIYCLHHRESNRY
uniref:Uncharacterized protein n=1 Tax=Theileria annulata TaxID=5874 RepID=A0A3B0N184_THEAN